jgi:hypothetical protein
VRVDAHFDGNESWIRIADDGCGMTAGELREAMRFGTRRSYAEDDLGRFGLGLKSASLSQCRRLTVASRKTSIGRLNLAQWDLDHIEETDRWEVLRPRARECRTATEPIRQSRGTSVLWEGLDRVTRYRVPDGLRATSDFDRLIGEIRAHLAMTFHRYLSRATRSGRQVTVFLNGHRVEPWDPYATDEPATTSLTVQRIRLNHNGARHSVTVRPYILPTEAAFSSAASHRQAAGPRFWTKQQGFYVYRNDRLIQAGGWNRLRTQDEHTKLARIAVDCPPGAEEAFELNVSKTQVRIPAAIRSELAAIASSVCGVAEDTYRRPRAADRSPETANERLDAIRELVHMVTGAVERMITMELDEADAVSQRLIGRLRELERQLERQLAERLGIDSATEPTDHRLTSPRPNNGLVTVNGG